MDLQLLIHVLRIISRHAPKATTHKDRDNILSIVYHGPTYLDLTSDEAEVLGDHRIGLYDGYAEIIL